MVFIYTRLNPHFIRSFLSWSLFTPDWILISSEVSCDGLYLHQTESPFHQKFPVMVFIYTRLNPHFIRSFLWWSLFTPDWIPISSEVSCDGLYLHQTESSFHQKFPVMVFIYTRLNPHFIRSFLWWSLFTPDWIPISSEVSCDGLYLHQTESPFHQKFPVMVFIYTRLNPHFIRSFLWWSLFTPDWIPISSEVSCDGLYLHQTESPFHQKFPVMVFIYTRLNPHFIRSFLWWSLFTPDWIPISSEVSCDGLYLHQTESPFHQKFPVMVFIYTRLNPHFIRSFLWWSLFTPDWILISSEVSCDGLYLHQTESPFHQKFPVMVFIYTRLNPHFIRSFLWWSLFTPDWIPISSEVSCDGLYLHQTESSFHQKFPVMVFIYTRLNPHFIRSFLWWSLFTPDWILISSEVSCDGLYLHQTESSFHQKFPVMVFIYTRLNPHFIRSFLWWSLFTPDWILISSEVSCDGLYLHQTESSFHQKFPVMVFIYTRLNPHFIRSFLWWSLFTPDWILISSEVSCDGLYLHQTESSFHQKFPVMVFIYTRLNPHFIRSFLWWSLFTPDWILISSEVSCDGLYLHQTESSFHQKFPVMVFIYTRLNPHFIRSFLWWSLFTPDWILISSEVSCDGLYLHQTESSFHQKFPVMVFIYTRLNPHFIRSFLWWSLFTPDWILISSEVSCDGLYLHQTESSFHQKFPVMVFIYTRLNPHFIRSFLWWSLFTPDWILISSEVSCDGLYLHQTESSFHQKFPVMVFIYTRLNPHFIRSFLWWSLFTPDWILISSEVSCDGLYLHQTESSFHQKFPVMVFIYTRLNPHFIRSFLWWSLFTPDWILISSEVSCDGLYLHQTESSFHQKFPVMVFIYTRLNPHFIRSFLWWSLFTPDWILISSEVSCDGLYLHQTESSFHQKFPVMVFIYTRLNPHFIRSFLWWSLFTPDWILISSEVSCDGLYLHQTESSFHQKFPVMVFIYTRLNPHFIRSFLWWSLFTPDWILISSEVSCDGLYLHQTESSFHQKFPVMVFIYTRLNPHFIRSFLWWSLFTPDWILISSEVSCDGLYLHQTESSFHQKFPVMVFIYTRLNPHFIRSFLSWSLFTPDWILISSEVSCDGLYLHQTESSFHQKFPVMVFIYTRLNPHFIRSFLWWSLFTPDWILISSEVSCDGLYLHQTESSFHQKFPVMVFIYTRLNPHFIRSFLWWSLFTPDWILISSEVSCDGLYLHQTESSFHQKFPVMVFIYTRLNPHFIRSFLWWSLFTPDWILISSEVSCDGLYLHQTESRSFISSEVSCHGLYLHQTESSFHQMVFIYTRWSLFTPDWFSLV